MTDDRLHLSVVFNGCIYNYRQLRRELEADYVFDSNGDTEVILKAYDRWGENLVDHLVGMFAFALVDERRSQVVLVRDRLGIKPLYVAELPGKLRFASTLPALVASGEIDTSIDRTALHHYLSWHSIVPAPRTIVNGVKKLPPATVRVVHADGRQRERVYWRPDYVRAPAQAAWSPAEWRHRIQDCLEMAAINQTVADVPVGVLLSGGLDSSLLVALLARAGQPQISTFSIGFEDVDDEAGDEFTYSDAVASEFGTDHHRLEVSAGDFADAIPGTVDAMTEPMSTQDVGAFYLLSRSVAEHTKVVQSGQGADEIFAGYKYHRMPEGTQRHEVAERFASAFVAGDAQVQRLLSPEWRLAADPSDERLCRELAVPGADTATDAVLRLDTHVLMPDDPVKRVDSMSMAWGLEARVPFLDEGLVELVAACPPELKTAAGGKGVLKQIGRDLLPAAVIDRPKGYFPVPKLRHLQEPFLGMARDALLAPEARERNLFRTAEMEQRLIDPDSRHSAVGGNELWNLAVLEMWLQHHRLG